MSDVLTAPRRRPLTALQWMRRNLFNSWGNTAVTLVCLYLLWLVTSGIFGWAFVNASWSGSDRTACLGPDQGACWPFIAAKFDQFIYGRYPADERWRPDLVFFFGAALLIPFLIPSAPYKRLNAVLLMGAYPVVAFWLLTGGFGLPPVDTSEWGGLLVTLVVAITGMAFSLPLGILLALGRRSSLPVIRILCVLFIELWRSVPLITVLFMASVMLPLFLPDGVTIDKLLRALIGVALFASAYMAEVVRGGLQAVPSGQVEAARALGLSYWQTMGFIVLPQALRTVIPGIVNNFIGMFKDTTLVLIVGIFDLLGIVQSNFTDPNWATPQTAMTGYVFAGLIFWIFCFGMSRYSLFIERRQGLGSAK